MREGLLPATLGSYRPGKDSWANVAVLASDVYQAFERKEKTLAVALILRMCIIGLTSLFYCKF